ncbi:MAG: hypothetical protein WDO69_04110 [Pseudomonadota bacterium]
MKSVVDHQSSAWMVQSTAGLSGGSAPTAARGAKRLSHWVFTGYLAVAAASLLYTFVQSKRFDGALARLRTCIARADSGCTSVELETARRIRPADVRLEIAEASLAVLLHQVDRAEANESALENRAKQDGASFNAEVRADLLLLRGDVASAKEKQAEARDDFAAARPLLADRNLVATRLLRIDAQEKAAHDQSAKELDSLKQDFIDLFTVATQGSREIMELRADKAQAWLGRVPHLEARHTLGFAVDAARRACNVVEIENRSAQAYSRREPPKPPVRGITDYSAGYTGSYDSQLTQYRDRLDRFNKERAEADERQEQRAAKAAEASNAAITQGRELLDDALQILRALPTPLSDAASAAPSDGRPAPALLVRPVYSTFYE